MDSKSNFVYRAYEIINSCDPNIAEWTSDGSSFIIKDIDQFETTIIPQYFAHAKFTSFLRQLHMYGFTRVQPKSIPGNAAMANNYVFYNENFKRNEEDLLHKIKRKKPTKDNTKFNLNKQLQKLQQDVLLLTAEEKRLQDEVKEVDKLHRRIQDLENQLGLSDINETNNEGDKKGDFT